MGFSWDRRKQFDCGESPSLIGVTCDNAIYQQLAQPVVIPGRLDERASRAMQPHQLRQVCQGSYRR